MPGYSGTKSQQQFVQLQGQDPQQKMMGGARQNNANMYSGMQGSQIQGGGMRPTSQGYMQGASNKQNQGHM